MYEIIKSIHNTSTKKEKKPYMIFFVEVVSPLFLFAIQVFLIRNTSPAGIASELNSLPTRSDLTTHMKLNDIKN